MIDHSILSNLAALFIVLLPDCTLVHFVWAHTSLKFYPTFLTLCERVVLTVTTS